MAADSAVNDLIRTSPLSPCARPNSPRRTRFRSGAMVKTLSPQGCGLTSPPTSGARPPPRWRAAPAALRGEVERARPLRAMRRQDGLRGLAGGARARGAGGGALLGLLAGFALLGVVARGALHEAGGVQEAQHPVGRLRALGEPRLHLLG